MFTRPNPIILFLLIEQFMFIETFFIAENEELMLVPSVAFRYHPLEMSLDGKADSTDDWILYAQGWYFKENPFRAIIGTSLLSTMVDDIDAKRVSYLTASGKRWKPLCLDGLEHQMCTKTDQHGLIEKQFRMTHDQIERFRVSGGTGGKVEYSVSTLDKRIQSKGEIFLCDDDGISIISDIDDTIKITGVTSARSVLRNTFTGEYKSVPGMAERYRQYESLYNATFHYLTASPDQLYPFLREFFDRERFPLGSYHMRHFSWFDKNFFEFFLSKSFIRQKTNILEMFLEQTRSRKFILFGDIFQKDPEIYANIYDKYPERILKIFIRSPQRKLVKRLNDVFQSIPKDKWSTFVDGHDLPDNILEN